MRPKIATAIPRSSLNFTCEELGWVLAKHWQENDYPVMGSVAVAVAAADAVKKAAETWQCTPLEAAERIKSKQEAWLKSTPGKSDTPKPAHCWYRDGYWLSTPEEWERREANRTGKNSKSRANELEAEWEHKSKEDLSGSCEMYGSKLVEHLIRRKYPVYPREVVVGMAADAVEQEAKAGGIMAAEAYTRILQAQKLYLKSWAGKQARILARKWYSERRYADDPESWRKEVQER